MGRAVPSGISEKSVRRLIASGELPQRRAIGCDEKYVRERERQLAKLAKECAWLRLGQITAASFVRWRSTQKKHPKTLNEYLNAISGLMNWLDAAHPAQSAARCAESANERANRCQSTNLDRWQIPYRPL